MHPYQLVFWAGFGILLTAAVHPLIRKVFAKGDETAEAGWRPFAVSSLVGLGCAGLLGWAATVVDPTPGERDLSYGVGIRVSY